MGAIASQITSLTIVYSTVYSDADQRKHQSSASLAFVWGIHRGPVNSPHKWPVTRKMFPFDDVIMNGVHSHVCRLSIHCRTSLGAGNGLTCLMSMALRNTAGNSLLTLSITNISMKQCHRATAMWIWITRRHSLKPRGHATSLNYSKCCFDVILTLLLHHVSVGKIIICIHVCCLFVKISPYIS